MRGEPRAVVSSDVLRTPHMGGACDAPARRRADLLLVCSTGGHLQQLLALRDAWGGYTRVWVTFDKSDARSLLRDEQVVYAYGPTNRSLKNLLRNLVRRLADAP